MILERDIGVFNLNGIDYKIQTSHHTSQSRNTGNIRRDILNSTTLSNRIVDLF